jgi:hypothetical protein
MQMKNLKYVSTLVLHDTFNGLLVVYVLKVAMSVYFLKHFDSQCYYYIVKLLPCIILLAYSVQLMIDKF